MKTKIQKLCDEIYDDIRTIFQATCYINPCCIFNISNSKIANEYNKIDEQIIKEMDKLEILIDNIGD